MQQDSALDAFIRRTHRRETTQLLCTEFAWGLSAALVGVILLLLADVEILAGPWLPILFVAGCGIAAWRTLQHKPTLYQSAQRADNRLGLHDLLSTAFHFQANSEGANKTSIVEMQRQFAAEAAAIADPSLAAPWHTPKQIWIAAGLLIAALGLGGLRYGFLGSIGMDQPIVYAVADFFHPGKTVSLTKRVSRNPQDDALPEWIPFQRDMNAKFQEFGTLPPDVMEELQRVAGQTGMNDASAEALKKAEKGEKADAQKAVQGEGNTPQEQGDEKGGSPGGDNGMMDQFKEAMSDLMAKLGTPKEGPGAQKQQQKQSKQGSGEAQKASGQGDPSQSQEGGEEGDEAGEGEQDDQQSSSSNANPNNSQGAGMGAGKGEGDKNAQLADQLAAMGKLTELIGKRSLMLTGEVTIESKKAEKQNLITSYDNKGQVQTEAGGEIRRDEVPAKMQQYVRQYFEQLRKTAPSPKPSR